MTCLHHVLHISHTQTETYSVAPKLSHLFFNTAIAPRLHRPPPRHNQDMRHVISTPRMSAEHLLRTAARACRSTTLASSSSSATCAPVLKSMRNVRGRVLSHSKSSMSSIGRLRRQICGKRMREWEKEREKEMKIKIKKEVKRCAGEERGRNKRDERRKVEKQDKPCLFVRSAWWPTKRKSYFTTTWKFLMETKTHKGKISALRIHTIKKKKVRHVSQTSSSMTSHWQLTSCVMSAGGRARGNFSSNTSAWNCLYNLKRDVGKADMKRKMRNKKRNKDRRDREKEIDRNLVEARAKSLEKLWKCVHWV